MFVDDNQMISAQVILLPASGRPIDLAMPVTAGNVAEIQPRPETYAQVASGFTELGYTTGPLVGVSFSITASARTFNKLFMTRVQATESGCESLDTEGRSSLELPLDHLPNKLRKQIQTVTLSPPPDFGPDEFF